MSKPQIYILLTLTSVILAAWSAVFYQHWYMTHTPMAKMWMPPSTLSAWSVFDFGVIFLMWTVMMTAMMLPSSIPMLLAFSRICKQRKQSVYYLSFIFILAYLSIWFLFSAFLTLLQWQLHGLLWLSPMMDNSNRYLAAAIFAAAAIYQFLPLKNACLKYCQSPLGFLLNNWRNSVPGVYGMGMRHGLICLGCCWAEMMVMFAVGVMNISGMIMITLLTTLEKLSPLKTTTSSYAGGVVFLCWAAYWLLRL